MSRQVSSLSKNIVGQISISSPWNGDHIGENRIPVQFSATYLQGKSGVYVGMFY